MDKSFIRKFIPKPTTLTIVLCGIMIAAEIVLERLIPIVNSQYMKVNLAFLPMAIVAILYGPLYCGAAWAITDLIGALLFPTGAYFPGFTISQFLSGIIFGVFLYRIFLNGKNTANIVTRIICAVLLQLFCIGLLLNTLWLSILFGKGYFALLPGRFAAALVNFAVEAVLIFALVVFMKKRRKQLIQFIK